MTTYAQDQMSLSITRPANSSVDYVQIVGDVDLSDSATLEVAAARLLAADGSSICVDLGGTTFMDSTLAAFLSQVGTADGQAGRTLVLCRPRPMARRIIEVTGLDRLATVRPDLPPLWPEPVAS
jgi:anti-anti-sigma factor